MVEGCTTAGIGCKDCKGRLGERMSAFMEKPLARKKQLLNSNSELDTIIEEGAARAKEVASQTLQRVHKAMGAG